MKNIFRHFTVLALAMLFSIPGNAQGTQSIHIRNWDKFQVELPVSSLLDPGYQRAKGILGWHLKPNLQLLAGGAYGLGSQSLLSFSAKKIDQKFWEASAGIRYFYHDNLRRKRSHYLEAEFSFLKEGFFRSDDWYTQNGQYLQYGGAAISKKSWRTGFYFGKQHQLGQRLFLRWDFGLSVRANQIKHIAFEPAIIEKPLIGGLMKKFDRKEGWSVGVIPVIRLSMGWQPFNQHIKIKNHRS